MAFVAITAGVGAAASITIAAIKNKKAKDAQPLIKSNLSFNKMQ